MRTSLVLLLSALLVLAMVPARAADATSTPGELVDAYSSLADVILGARHSEANLMRSILAATYRHAEAQLARAKEKMKAGKPAREEVEALAALVALGMTTLIGIPALVNASVVMGLLPTTGFTLPFVSYGGNSLLICSLAIGILLRVGACEAAPTPTRISGASRRRIGRT